MEARLGKLLSFTATTYSGQKILTSRKNKKKHIVKSYSISLVKHVEYK